MNVDNTLVAHEMCRGLLGKMVADVAPERMTQQFPPFVNHPMWQLGHIALTYNGIAKMLGQPSELNDHWGKLFGMGSQPTSDASVYPAKAEMVATFDRLHQKLPALIRGADAAAFAAANPVEKMRPMLPTVGHLASFLMTSHAFLHVGQMTSWRKLAGLPGVL